MTGNTSRCPYYKAESQNVKEKSHCVANIQELPFNVRNDLDRYFRRNPVPQTEEECEVNSRSIINKINSL